MLVSSCVCIEGGADDQQGAEHELNPLIKETIKPIPLLVFCAVERAIPLAISRCFENSLAYNQCYN